MCIESFDASYSNGELRLDAVGLVPTGGWSEPELRVMNGEVEFVATPPSGIVTPVISEIGASTKLKVHPAACED